MMRILDTYIYSIKRPLNKNESYWPVPYFMGEYTQNDKERYFDYMPFPAIYNLVGNFKV